MVIFAVALRSKESSNNWNNVVKNFNATLRSIFNQTVPDFMVCVGCNEIPPLYEKYDERLKFFTVNNPLPKTHLEACRDKFWKYLLVACEIKKYLLSLDNPEKGIFVMPIDADDLLSKHIVEYANSHTEANGFVSDYGYVRFGNSKILDKYPQMHTLCGSCNVIKMYPEDLPDNMPDQSLCFDKATAGILNERYPIRWNHNEVFDKYKSMGKELSVMPFPSTIYCLGNGENISMWDKNDEEDKKDIKRRMRAVLSSIKHLPERTAKKRYLNKKIREEFAVAD